MIDFSVLCLRLTYCNESQKADTKMPHTQKINHLIVHVRKGRLLMLVMKL